MPSVVFDHGHVGRTGGRPPAHWQGLYEHKLVAQYVLPARLCLEDQGWETAVTGLGRYPDRQRLASDLGFDYYLACHCNAGAAAVRAAGNTPGGAVFYHYASARGPAVANRVAARLQARTGIRVRTFASRPDDWTRNAYALHRHAARCVGLVIEPGYLDDIEHQHLWTPSGLRQVGLAVAEGLLGS
jgi:N-acetylmuramoyl-L-alanine amidase